MNHDSLGTTIDRMSSVTAGMSHTGGLLVVSLTEVCARTTRIRSFTALRRAETKALLSKFHTKSKEHFETESEGFIVSIASTPLIKGVLRRLVPLNTSNVYIISKTFLGHIVFSV